MTTIDLNCDVGESTDATRFEVEARVLDSVSSISIACGFHAGNQNLMRRMVKLAKERRVAVGAHPGFHDREHCGRREHHLSSTEVEDLVAYQVGALQGIAALEGVVLRHVKPHGALYNMAARDANLSMAIARAVARLDPRLILVGLANHCLIAAARLNGLQAAQEAFADRAYRSDGTLVPRDQPGAVIVDEREVVGRALSLVRDACVPIADGHRLEIHADTICVHADTQGAEGLVLAIARALREAGVKVAPMGKSDA